MYPNGEMAFSSLEDEMIVRGEEEILVREFTVEENSLSHKRKTEDSKSLESKKLRSDEASKLAGAIVQVLLGNDPT
jgi:hypothetical protein